MTSEKTPSGTFAWGALGSAPGAAYRALRDNCPVLRTGDGGTAVISRYQDVLLADRRRSLSMSWRRERRDIS